MSRRSDSHLLDDILEAVGKIRRYIFNQRFSQFAKDEKTVDAVVRNLEIIGEAAGRLSQGFKEANPEIEWRKVAGLRNRIVHEYFGIDVAIIWEVVRKYLPLLSKRIKRIHG